MTEDIGPEAAQEFADAHESETKDSRDPKVRASSKMDLYNNAVGRKLAMDPKNKDRSPEEVVMEALDSGLLQTSPDQDKGPPPGLDD